MLRRRYFSCWYCCCCCRTLAYQYPKETEKEQKKNKTNRMSFVIFADLISLSRLAFYMTTSVPLHMTWYRAFRFHFIFSFISLREPYPRSNIWTTNTRPPMRRRTHLINQVNQLQVCEWNMNVLCSFVGRQANTAMKDCTKITRGLHIIALNRYNTTYIYTSHASHA